MQQNPSEQKDRMQRDNWRRLGTRMIRKEIFMLGCAALLFWCTGCSGRPIGERQEDEGVVLTKGQKMLQAVINGKMDAIDYGFKEGPTPPEDDWPETLSTADKEAVVESALKVVRDPSKADLLRLNAGILVVAYSSDPQLIKEGKAAVEEVGRDGGPFMKDGIGPYGTAVTFLAGICDTGDKLSWAESLPNDGATGDATWQAQLRSYTRHPKALEESLAILGVKGSEDGTRVAKEHYSKTQTDPFLLTMGDCFLVEELDPLMSAIKGYEKSSGQMLSRSKSVVKRAIAVSKKRYPRE